MDPYQIICLLKGINVMRMEACATNIKVKVTIHEPYGDPLSVGRPRLTQRQLAAFALDFPHAIRDVLRDVVSERDEIQRELRRAETESSMLRVECGVIAKERDEARREVCTHEADTAEDQRQYAAQRGWDCFPLSEEHTTISYKETP
jgi:hypothetical protein